MTLLQERQPASEVGTIVSGMILTLLRGLPDANSKPRVSNDDIRREGHVDQHQGRDEELAYLEHALVRVTTISEITPYPTTFKLEIIRVIAQGSRARDLSGSVHVWEGDLFVPTKEEEDRAIR